MNYAESLSDINPLVNDTPAALTSLKNLLQARTKETIPFFLMPVRLETRFMKVMSNLIFSTTSTSVRDTRYVIDIATAAARDYATYELFRSDTAVAAAREIQRKVSDITIVEIAALNPADKIELQSGINALAASLTAVYSVLEAACDDPNLIPELIAIGQLVAGVISQLITDIESLSDDGSWTAEISESALLNWNSASQNTIQALNSHYDLLFAGNQFNPLVFADYNQTVLSLVTNCTVAAENDYDKLYAWTKINSLDAQFSSIYSYIESLEEIDPENHEDLHNTFLIITTKFRDAWKQFLFPGISSDRLSPGFLSDAVAPEGTFIAESTIAIRDELSIYVAEARTLLEDMKALGEEFDDSRYDTYIGILGEIKHALQAGPAEDSIEQGGEDWTNSEIGKATIWRAVEPLNTQFAELEELLIAVPEAIPGSTAARLSRLDASTIGLADVWTLTLEPATTYTTVVWSSTTHLTDQLWIRVYPDDIEISSFEEALTLAEVAAGTAYWTAWWHAHGNTSLQLAAWQAIVALYGPERAAWIVKAMTPTSSISTSVSPVFGFIDHVTMLAGYTAHLTLEASTPEMAHHLRFYDDQLTFLEEKITTIQALPVEDRQTASSAMEAFLGRYDGLSAAIAAEHPYYFDEENPNLTQQEVAAIDSELRIPSGMLSASRIRIVDIGDTVIGVAVLEGGWGTVYTDPPVFPTPATRASDWTKPSTSYVMPDRFLFAAVNKKALTVYPSITSDPDPINDPAFGAYRFHHIQIGNLIPDPLYTGLDPAKANFAVNAIGNLETDPRLKWAIDFPTAVANGMAIQMLLTAAEATQGFDTILALGLKLKSTVTNSTTNRDNLPNIGKGLLEKLLNDHHYTSGGMAVMQLGTATNNTDKSNAGFNQADPNCAGSFETEITGATFSGTVATLAKTDGQWLCDALGIEYSVLQHIENTNKKQISKAISMNRSLFNGTIGNYMGEMLNFLFTEDNITHTKDYFTDYVLGRGAVPSIRIGHQPYGILPVTSFGRWQAPLKFNGNFPDEIKGYYPNPDLVDSIFGGAVPFPPPTFSAASDALGPFAYLDAVLNSYINSAGANKARGINSYLLQDYAAATGFDLQNFLHDRFQTRLPQILEKLNRQWSSMAAWYIKTVDKNSGLTNTQQNFMEILGTDASVSEVYARYMMNLRPFTSSFTPDNMGQDSAHPYSFWNAPDGVGGLSGSGSTTDNIDIPNLLFKLFDNFKLPKPVWTASSFNPLGDGYGIFDIPELLQYKKVVDNYINAISDPSTTKIQNAYAIPNHEKIRNVLRVLNSILLPETTRLYGPSVDEKPLSERNPLTPFASGGIMTNYISWMQASTLEAVKNNNAFSALPSRSLLFLLMRQSLLLTYRETALDIIERSGVLKKVTRKLIGTPEGLMMQGVSPASINITKPLLTKWDLLFTSLKDLHESGDFGASLAAFSTYTTVLNGAKYDNFFGVALGSLPASTTPPTVLTDIIDTGWGDKKLSQFLKGAVTHPGLEALVDRAKINNLNEAFSDLVNCSTAELDRLLREHIDLCTYRLDAWNSGMVNKRLWQIRKTDKATTLGSRQKGVYLGAYSWLLNVRPKFPTGFVEMTATHLPTGLGVGTDPIYYDRTNLGFIHTPSMAHALTAAILRSGYMSENDSTDNRFAVNLTSERVRTAMSLLDGMRNGQQLGALLGYMFERALRDNNPSLMLEPVIYNLRKRYPLVKTNTIKNNTHVTTSGDSTHLAPTSANKRPVNILDGVELLNAFRSGSLNTMSAQNPKKSVHQLYSETATASGFAGHYFSFASANGLPALTSTEGQAIVRQLDRIADAMDALGDLVVAEGVFQMSKGNFDRSSTIAESVTEGHPAPRPEIIDTPSRGIKITHKAVAAIKPSVSTTNPWTSVTLTARAKTEPSINNWLSPLLRLQFPASVSVATFLGNVGCTVSYTNPNSGSPITEVRTVVLANLSVQPIDLLYMQENGLFKSELAERVRFYARIIGIYNGVTGIPHDVNIQIDYTNRGTATLASFQDLLTSLSSLSALVNGSRWLKAQDFIVVPDTATTSTAPYDLPELTARYTALDSQFSGLISFFSGAGATAATIGSSPSGISTIRTRLFEAASMGISFAVPVSAIESNTNAAAVAKLAAQAQSVKTELLKRQTATIAINAAYTAIISPAPEQTAKARIDYIAAVLGSNFKALPQFKLGTYTGLKAAIDNQLNPASGGLPDIMRNFGTDIAEKLDGWMYGVSMVRAKMDNVETLRLLLNDDDHDHPLNKFRPVQFPYVNATAASGSTPATDADYWLGLEYPTTSYTPAGDKVSVMVFNYTDGITTILPVTDLYCGLVIDEWSETIPLKSRPTAIAFNYDQPNAKPPQSVLLAVSPNTVHVKDTVTYKDWKLEDLLHTLLDTIDMSKIRMVEPDHFRQAGTRPDAATNPDINPYTGAAVSSPPTSATDPTKKFEIFKWLLPAIVGEVTKQVSSASGGVFSGSGTGTGTVSGDFGANNAVVPGTTGGPIFGGGPIYTGPIGSSSATGGVFTGGGSSSGGGPIFGGPIFTGPIEASEAAAGMLAGGGATGGSGIYVSTGDVSEAAPLDPAVSGGLIIDWHSSDHAGVLGSISSEEILNNVALQDFAGKQKFATDILLLQSQIIDHTSNI